MSPTADRRRSRASTASLSIATVDPAATTERLQLHLRHAWRTGWPRTVMTPGAGRADDAGRFRRRTRNAVLTAHIVVSVGLLGDSAGFVAVAIRRATSDDPAFVETAHDLLGTFALVFGIPLSFLALFTGIALGLGTPWGLFRYPWVVAKLILIITVIAVGALVLRPVLDDHATTADSTTLIVGAAYDVAALTAATTLAVFKPGRARRRALTSPASAMASARPNDP